MDDVVTFVNIIEVDPALQAEVVKILRDGTETVISKQPGFVSVTILASVDRTHVLNLARWRSPADVKAVQSHPAAAVFAQRIAAVAKPTPGLYELVGRYGLDATVATGAE